MKKIIYALFTIVVFNLSASAEELEVECDQQKRSLGFLKSATTVAALGAYLYLLR